MALFYRGVLPSLPEGAAGSESSRSLMAEGALATQLAVPVRLQGARDRLQHHRRRQPNLQTPIRERLFTVHVFFLISSVYTLR